MKQGYVNWKLVLVLILGVCAIGVTMVGLRRLNRTHRAEQGLTQGLEAYEARHWATAAGKLGQHLAVHPSDVDILLKYGHALSRMQPFRRDHYSQAVNAYRTVLRLDETNLDAALSLVELYLKAGVPAEAELVASRFLERKYDAQLTLRLAAAQIMQRKYEQAAQLLTGMLPGESSRTAVYELLANIARQRPELVSRTPREWIEAAVENNPQSANAYILRGRFLMNAGRPEEAFRNLEQAARCDLSDVQSRLSLAASWLRLNAVEQAEEQLDAAYEHDPRLPELWQLRAMAAAKRADPVSAVRIAREGLEHLEEARGIFLPYAVELFLLAREVDRARAALQEMRGLGGGGGVVPYLEGVLAEYEGDWSRAMMHWREAVVQGYTVEPVYLKLAEGSVRLEDRIGAIEILRRYIAQNPDSVAAQLALARIYAEAQHWSEASDYAAAAARIDPDNNEAQNMLIRSRVQMLAAQPNAQPRVDKLLAELTARDDSVSNRMLAFRIALSRQNWDQAQQILDLLADREGPSLQLKMAQTEYHLRRGQYAEADIVIKEAMRAYPDAAEPVILRSVIHVQQHNPDEAITFLETAVSRLEGENQRRVQLWLADQYQQAGRSEEAFALFSGMASSNPQDILARRRLLALRRAEGEVLQLQQWIDEIQQIEGQAGRLWRVEQVWLWIARGDIGRRYSEAVTLLNENLKTNSDDKQSLILLAAAHEQAGHMRLAVSLYREALTRNPDDVDLAIAALGAMYRAEEFRQAEQMLADLLAAGHTDPRLAQLELQSHLRQGRLDSAEDLLEKMVLQNVHDSSAKMALAMLRTRNGQFAAAKTLIDGLISEDPDAVSSYAALADWHFRQNQPDMALAVCEDFLDRHDTVPARQLYCRVLLAMNETEKAIEQIENIRGRAADDVNIWLAASELYAAAGQRERAIDAARRALMIDSDSFEAQKQMALLLASHPATLSEGMVLLDTAMARQPRDVQLRLRKASLLLGRGQKAAAEGIEMLNTLVHEYPRLESAWGYLVEWYLLNNRPGMAMDTVLRGLAVMPDNRMLLMSKARIESIHSLPVAMETLRQLAFKYPSDDVIIEMQAELLRRAERRAEAVKRLSDRVSSDSVPVSLRLLYMELLYETDDKNRAKQLFEDMLKEPETASAAVTRWTGLIIGTEGADQVVAVFQRWYDAHPKGGAAARQILQNMLAEQTPEAIIAAEKILRLVQAREPDSPEAAFGMAMLYHMTGRKMDAIPHYERTLHLQPDNVVAINNLAWILSQDKGEHQKALKLAEDGLLRSPDYLDLIDTRGTILFSLGLYEKAADDFRTAAERYLDSQPQKTVSVYYLARSLVRMGRNEQARVEFYRARDLDERVGGLSDQQRLEIMELVP